MPVVWERDGIKISVYPPPRESHPRPHVHAKFKGKEASICIVTGEILANTGFTERELKALVSIVEDNREDFLTEWGVYHGGQ